MKAYGLLFWATNLGYSIAMVARGWLAEHHARTMFGVNAAVAVAFACVVWRAVPESRPAEGKVPGACLWTVLRDRTPGDLRGVSGMSWAAGAAIAPLAGTALLPLGPEPLWCGLGAVGLASSLVMLMTGAAVRRRAWADGRAAD